MTQQQCWYITRDMRTYDLVKSILSINPESRNSDKKLIWVVFEKLGYLTSSGTIDFEDMIKAPSMETITRCRRKIQERYSELRATNEVESARKYKQSKFPHSILTEKARPRQYRFNNETGMAEEIDA